MNLNTAIEHFSRWKSCGVKPHTASLHAFLLRNFALFLGERDIEAVTLEDVVAYLKRLRELGWSVNYLARACLTLRHFFTFLRAEGGRVLNPRLIPRPRKALNPPRVATEAEFEQLLALIPEGEGAQHTRDRAMLAVLWDTGMRVGELCSLDVEDVDLNRMRSIVRTEKSRGARPFRDVFWTRATNERLGRWLEIRERVPRLARTPALFAVVVGPTAGARLTNRTMGELLRRYSRRAGVRTLNAHSFRHHRGHEIIMRGGSAADAMNILGHASLQSSSVYTMMADRELEARYRRVRGWQGVPDAIEDSASGSAEGDLVCTTPKRESRSNV